ncbi:MAG: class I SAM-dependent methyltransferase, partial [Nitrospirales bacterium]|nr:class I SAM-dependent methyltransferase [Nitrospirales bacterium]
MSYRNQFYQRYISTHFGAIREISLQACENQVEIFRSYFKKHLPKNTQAKVLDLGCGFGSFLYFLRKEGFQDVHGVEISTEQVAAAKSIGIPNMSCNDIIDYLKDNPESFDCVVALDVIEHFPKSEICTLI